MRLAVLSDIHGNLEALHRVLADADAQQAEHMVCLGDCIGYGPEPEAVIREIRGRSIPAITGNHEMVVQDRIHLKWFNFMARRSLEKTLAMLSADSLACIRALPFSRSINESRFVHGFPPDSARTYLFEVSDSQLRQTFETMVERICFVGHTHDLELIGYDGSLMERRPLNEGITRLSPDGRYLVNVGSVGQPRDGTSHAKYVIWDSDEARLETRFVSYDIAKTVAGIRVAGLPEAHARCLM